MNRRKGIIPIILFLIASSQVSAAPTQSILVSRTVSPGKVQKVPGNEFSRQIQSGINAMSVEQLRYRGFTILLNPMSNGSYEVQASRQVLFGGRRVSSIFSSMYESSVEYGYEYDSSRRRIIQYHFLFPPNSLTGWANPDEVAAFQKFEWGEPYPIRNCGQNEPIHTLEEAGREYLEASCMPDRDTALRFARNFIDYMLSNRGL